jgi:hypothetical protein
VSFLINLIYYIYVFFFRYIWSYILNKKSSVRLEKWPDAGIVDENILKGENFVEEIIYLIRRSRKKFIERKAKRSSIQIGEKDFINPPSSVSPIFTSNNKNKPPKKQRQRNSISSPSCEKKFINLYSTDCENSDIVTNITKPQIVNSSVLSSLSSSHDYPIFTSISPFNNIQEKLNTPSPSVSISPSSFKGDLQFFFLFTLFLLLLFNL